MKVSMRLKELMKANKLSTPKLSASSGVPIPSIKSILSGQSKNPRGSTLISLSKALDCSVQDLMYETEVIVQKDANNPKIKDHITADEIFINILSIIDKIASEKNIDLSVHHEFKKQCAKRIFDNTINNAEKTNTSIDPVYAEWVFESLWEG
jgi:transcriptional regulator with XRE-family HTH domain